MQTVQDRTGQCNQVNRHFLDRLPVGEQGWEEEWSSSCDLSSECPKWLQLVLRIMAIQVGCGWELDYTRDLKEDNYN